MDKINETEISAAKQTFESKSLGDLKSFVELFQESGAVLLAAYNKLTIQPNTEAHRLISLAKTSLEQSIMWSTKAVSRAAGGTGATA